MACAPLDCTWRGDSIRALARRKLGDFEYMRSAGSEVVPNGGFKPALVP